MVRGAAVRELGTPVWLCGGRGLPPAGDATRLIVAHKALSERLVIQGRFVGCYLSLSVPLPVLHVPHLDRQRTTLTKSHHHFAEAAELCWVALGT